MRGWPKPYNIYTHGVHTVFVAGIWSNLQTYTVYICKSGQFYGFGQPYTSHTQRRNQKVSDTGGVALCCMRGVSIFVGLARTIYVRHIYNMFGREITDYLQCIYKYTSGQPYVYDFPCGHSWPPFSAFPARGPPSLPFLHVASLLCLSCTWPPLSAFPARAPPPLPCNSCFGIVIHLFNCRPGRSALLLSSSYTLGPDQPA